MHACALSSGTVVTSNARARVGAPRVRSARVVARCATTTTTPSRSHSKASSSSFASSFHRVGGASGLTLGGGAAERGSSLAMRAKKKKSKKKKEPEPEPEPEPEDDDADADADAFLDGADAANGEDGADGLGDASELLPGASRGASIADDEDDEAYEYEEEEETTSAFGVAIGKVTDAARNPTVRNVGFLGLAILAGSFALSCYNVYMRYNSTRSKRKRQVNKNVVVVERLRDFFPENRDSLTRGHIRGLQGKTGFAPPEIFRKYLRYKLNEEPFTTDFIADALALKAACDLDAEIMKSVLLETGERMVKKYGIIMRDVSDMSGAGVERKVDGCAMFAKARPVITLIPIRPRWRGARQSLRTLPGASLRTPLGFDALPHDAFQLRLTDAFKLHPDDNASRGTALR